MRSSKEIIFFAKILAVLVPELPVHPFHPWTAISLISAGKWQILLFKVTSDPVSRRDPVDGRDPKQPPGMSETL